LLFESQVKIIIYLILFPSSEAKWIGLFIKLSFNVTKESGCTATVF